MRSIDLFCGAGGLTRGLQQAGWDTAAAIDYDMSAGETYRANYPEVALTIGDVRSVDFTSWRERVDLVAGGPPCQPFSVAGRQLSFNDPRDCVPEFIRVVAEVHPSAFLMENVPGLDSPRHRVYLSSVIQRLEELGFIVSKAILNAADYGVPQFRSRLFLVGMRRRRFRFPKPTHGPKGELPYVTAGIALAGTPVDSPNTAKVTYAKNPVLRPQSWDGMLVNGGGRPINLDEPSQTIPASAGGNRTHILDTQGVFVEYHRYLLDGGQPLQGEMPNVRRLTVHESARLQSFPDSHVFLGKQTARYKQVGNAVPPHLAEAVSGALLSQLRDEYTDTETTEPEVRQLTFFSPFEVAM